MNESICIFAHFSCLAFFSAKIIKAMHIIKYRSDFWLVQCCPMLHSISICFEYNITIILEMIPEFNFFYQKKKHNENNVNL